MTPDKLYYWLGSLQQKIEETKSYYPEIDDLSLFLSSSDKEFIVNAISDYTNGLISVNIAYIFDVKIYWSDLIESGVYYVAPKSHMFMCNG